MKNIKNRLAFSMLELIFVIVILGIVASIGSEVIAKVYESYIVQRAQHRASVKTQLALNQIATRLRYAIPDTVIRKLTKTGASELLSDYMSLDTTGEGYTVLQWVAYDGDSFEAITSNANTGAGRRPGWSGFCDLNSSTSTSISTPASNFTLTNAIQSNLGGSGTFAIYFPNNSTAYYGTGSGQTITLGTAATRISERYKLAWTSYALVVEDDDGDGKFDLNLYYNFSPTVGTNTVGSSSLLLKNVTNFKFTGRGQTTRIKLCVEENIGDGGSIPSCKEKAVF
ncbi:type II secretion system protein [Sulfurovum sp.]|uniref:type II secretion system protein n=1 Tax=Sulfurovum sp. TaxID=1969726 RepID=UPI00356A99E5